MIVRADGWSPPLVEVDNLYVHFGRQSRPVVKGISFSLNRGECLALVGESGSGKSVTARTLVGLTGYGAQVQAEKLSLDGEDLTRFDERSWRRVRGSRVGFIMQDALGSLDPLRRVGQEIGEPLRLHRQLTRAEHDAKVISLLQEVGIPLPEMRARQYPFQLSGGLRQRAMIASAIACEPRLLIADEPTTALDATIQAQVLDLLESLRTAHNGLLVISHDLAVVARLADRVAVMRHGEIVELGTTESVLEDPQHEYTKSLLAAAASVHAGGISWEEPETPRHPRPRDHAVIVLEARDLTKSFAGPDQQRQTVVSEVSLQLHAGETVGIVGESGSGKTTLIRMILGLESPDEGEVRLRGKVWTHLTAKEQRAERKRIQVVFQDPLASFDPRYTVERVVGEALEMSGYSSAAARRQRTVELLQLVRLNRDCLTRRPIELSGGQRQRVAIARALAPEPEILVCDEPVSALDVSVQAQILELLEDLKQRLHLSSLFISHDLGIIRRVSDRVLVMKNGRVVESGDAEEVFERPQHPYTQDLLNSIPRINRKREQIYV